MERISRTQLSLYGRDGRRKYLTRPERRRFIEAAWQCPRLEVGTLGLVIAFTGCRISEALELCTSRIETEECSVAIRSLKKRGKLIMREIPLPPFLIARLILVHDIDHARPDTRLWHWSRGRAWYLLKDIMREACIAPGVHATAKGLRHAFAIHGLQSGVPINLVSRWLGHASLATTAIYLDAIGEEEREFAARMWTEMPRSTVIVLPGRDGEI